MVAILCDIRSSYNVGSIFRTADAAGFEKIYLCGITPAPVDKFGRANKEIAKTALGAEKYVEWERVKSATALIKKLKKEKYEILAIEQAKNSIPYYKMAKRKSLSANHKIALMVGNEVKGLPKSILNKADKILEIPMRGAMVRQAHHPSKTKLGKESLNVSVAFGIAAFYLSIEV